MFYFYLLCLSLFVNNFFFYRVHIFFDSVLQLDYSNIKQNFSSCAMKVFPSDVWISLTHVIILLLIHIMGHTKKFQRITEILEGSVLIFDNNYTNSQIYLFYNLDYLKWHFVRNLNFRCFNIWHKRCIFKPTRQYTINWRCSFIYHYISFQTIKNLR